MHIPVTITPFTPTTIIMMTITQATPGMVVALVDGVVGVAMEATEAGVVDMVEAVEVTMEVAVVAEGIMGAEVVDTDINSNLCKIKF